MRNARPMLKLDDLILLITEIKAIPVGCGVVKSFLGKMAYTVQHAVRKNILQFIAQTHMRALAIKNRLT